MSLRPLLLGVLALALVHPAAEAAPEVSDPRPADPSRPTLAFHVDADGLIVRQYALDSLAQLGYLIGHEGQALIVDPPRDAELYLRDAEALGLEVHAVLLTHLHDDFVAGHAEVARRTGATIYAPAASDLQMEHEALEDGRRLTVGGLGLEVFATPGHAADGITVLLRRPGREAADFVFPGDLVLPGTVGAPPLGDGREPAAPLAAAAYDALQLLALLPDETRLLPAHGGGFYAGRMLERWTVTRVGRERRDSPFWTTPSRSCFVARVLSLSVEASPAAERIRALNRRGAPHVSDVGVPPRVSPDALAARLTAGARLVDLRGAKDYAAAHLRGALNLPLEGPFATFFGAYVPADADLVLVGGEEDLHRALRRLRLIGVDRVAGCVAVEVEAWRAAGLDVLSSAFVSAADLARRREAWVDPLLVDVRSAREVAVRRITGALHVPLPMLGRLPMLVERERTLLFACQTAFRSTLAVGLAERQGFEAVGVLAGGLAAWAESGLPIVGEEESPR